MEQDKDETVNPTEETEKMETDRAANPTEKAKEMEEDDEEANPT